ncbi:MAG: molybdate ABC transporter substrate-binding protein [Thermoanaerobaculia bacterium]
MHIRLLSLFLVGLLLACGAGSENEALDVFAAASLRDVAGELAAELEDRHPLDVVFNFAGSNTLAQQILAAPRADVFLSADSKWVDFLDDAGRTVPGSRRDVFSNRLVLIAHRDAVLEVDEPRDLAVAEYRFLALADPEAVPAGRYAKASLERLSAGGGSLWDAVSGRVAPVLDVRAALALVESDPEILGIVYRTDMITSKKVRPLYEFPPMDELPITYCAVLIAGGDHPETGRVFLDFLQTPAAAAIAERHGFVIPGR